MALLDIHDDDGGSKGTEKLCQQNNYDEECIGG